MTTTPSMPAVTTRPSGSEGMRFSVDGWDPSYGSSVEVDDDLGESTASITTDVEMPDTDWRSIRLDSTIAQPSALLFVDGVRRIEARVWIDEETTGGAPATDATPGLCASYAAGVMCCCHQQAHLLTVETRRGLFSIAPHAVDVTTYAGTYEACHTPANPMVPLSMTLSEALQRRLGDIEVLTAVAARSALAGRGPDDGADLLVVDGPLRGRQHLPRSLGFIKSHRTAYLPPNLHSMVASLTAGERTPVFLMGTSWERHSWYLRLPCPVGSPWTGIVRIECSADLKRDTVIDLANLSQVTLPRFASTEYKDARAPQNLYPIAGLERQLRRRLGDTRLLYRALRQAAAR